MDLLEEGFVLRTFASIPKTQGQGGGRPKACRHFFALYFVAHAVSV
jgi:hypothetical protein